MATTTTTTATVDIAAELTRLREENARLLASRPKVNDKNTPAYIKDGVVHFPGVGSLTGLHLNPEAFLSLVKRLPAVQVQFEANEAQIRADYAARKPFVAKR